MSNSFGFTDLMNKDEHKRKKTNTKNIPIEEIKENENNNYDLELLELSINTSFFKALSVTGLA